MSLYIGLLHYPVYNRRGEIIVSAITSLDLHDLARLAKTYGVKKFYVINPLI
ncbi:MAG: RNA methyltransferase, partial [Deltaproteobacteria bacterium]|nr:RNA methyltransferase [Deltaproteobacteria bacterium]